MHTPETRFAAAAYTRTAITLHWLVAALIAGAFSVAWSLPEHLHTPADFRLLSIHKWIGITVFGAATLRLLWRLGHPAPPLPSSTPLWQQRAARGSHALLYALIFLIPLSGYLMSSAAGSQVVYLGVLPLPLPLAKDKALAQELFGVHQALTTTLLVLLSVHVLAALKHHFVDRDSVLRRILGRE
ncbi:MAG: cytochrome b [Gammaproteobacteria bacterium]|nr:cytochrome b [Gammaproteobacteria bacterium]